MLLRAGHCAMRVTQVLRWQSEDYSNRGWIQERTPKRHVEVWTDSLKLQAANHSLGLNFVPCLAVSGSSSHRYMFAVALEANALQAR